MHRFQLTHRCRWIFGRRGQSSAFAKIVVWGLVAGGPASWVASGDESLVPPAVIAIDDLSRAQVAHAEPVSAIVPPPVSASDNSTNEIERPLFLRDSVDPPMIFDGEPFHSTQLQGVQLHADRVQYDPHLGEDHAPFFWHVTEETLHALTLPIEPLGAVVETLTHAEHDHVETQLSRYPIGLQPIPARPNLPIELNEQFLAPGFLEQGVVLPTGAVWRPALWAFGTYRVGYGYTDPQGGATVSEVAQRLDLFGQLNLTGTERVVLGLRPFDEQTSRGRRFTSYDFNDGDGIDALNAEVQTLFFEGDFGEIFPNLDPYDAAMLDYGFSVGRQPMSFQQGLLINEDRIDAGTVTRNTLNGFGNLNLRMTGVVAWDEVHRNNNVLDPDAQLIGLFTESDFRSATVNADFAYVNSETDAGDLFAFGLSAIQRIHGYENTYNSSLHVLASFPTEGETDASGRGVLLFSQASWTPHRTHDLVYLNGFWAIDQFTSPARGPLAGGPLGQTGVLFSAPGLGRVGAPISNQASDVIGASLGYQLFFDHTRQQIIFEIAGREPTDQTDAAAAIGARLQRALGQHWIALVDTFLSKEESRRLNPGIRFELLMKF